MATPIPDNDAQFLLSEIAEITGGRVLCGNDTRVAGVVIDSRRVRPGTLFVAIRGEQQDGARFLPAAVAAGASALLVHAGTACPPGVAAVEVADTTRALGDLARFHRRRWGKKLVAITGSVGKTTTKELTAHAFEGLGRNVLRTEGNLNNYFGVPMTLFGLLPAHDVAVLEVGTSARGEIARLGAMAEPDVAVVLVAATAHTAGLGNVENVADEKAALFGALSADGVQVVNADDPRLRSRVRGGIACLRFGSVDADVRLARCELHEHGTEIEVVCGAQRVVCTLGLLGQALALDATAALAAVIALEGASALEAAAAGMTRTRATRGRMAPLATPSGLLVLDDSYNASPRSIESSVDTLLALARLRGGHSLAVLGDMRELGSESAAEHARIGEHCVRRGVDVLVGCGAEMGHATAAAARLSGGRLALHPTRVVHVTDPQEVMRMIGTMLGPRDVVLVKGSRAMAMERVVDALLAREAGQL